MSIVSLLLLLSGEPATVAPPAAQAATAPSGVVQAADQTTAEWTAWCQATADQCQADLSKLVLNRARMTGEYGCADETDDKIRASVLKWMLRHPKVADLPAKEGLNTAIQDIWVCLKPKFQGRIP